jgi:predicted kinase
MKTLHIYQGIQGSGKSTRARQFVLEDPDNRIRVNRDEIRLMIGKPFNPKMENLVTQIENAALVAAFKTGKDVISDNMNLNSRIRRNLEKMAQSYEYDVEYHFVYTPLEVCIERDSKRQYPVGEKVIRETYEKYKDYVEEHNPENERIQEKKVSENINSLYKAGYSVKQICEELNLKEGLVYKNIRKIKENDRQFNI